MGWSVGFSERAVESLRRLGRSEQREIAARIDQLEEAGPPPTTTEGGIVEIPAGPQRLLCVVVHENREIVVVTLRSAEASSARVVGSLAWRHIGSLLGGGGWMEEVRRELFRAARRMIRTPGFTLATVLTLGLGIGATTATFSVANGVLLRPLPYEDADRVVSIWSSWVDFPKTWVSEDEFLFYRQQSRSFDDVGLYFTSAHNLTSSEDPERVGSGVVSHNLFDVLGVDPVLGRAFTREEAATEASVVLLSHGLWQRRYRGDPSLVGQDIPVNGRPFTVLGILPPDFRLPVDFRTASPSEVYFAMPTDVDEVRAVPENGGDHGYYAAARLRAGATVEDARRDLTALAGGLVAEGTYSESWQFRPIVLSAKDDIVGSAKATILVLLGACGFVLLIACANVANLLLSRSEQRKQDMSVLRALGASRRRLLTQLLIEALVLAVAGGVVGWVVALGGVEVFTALNPEAIPRSTAIRIDGRVMAFTAMATGLTALLFGWLPALRVVGRGSQSVARRGRRTTESSRTQRLLVATQMAMAVVLLTGSGLLIRTFVKLTEIDPGFRAENVLTMRLTAPSATYPEAADVAGFYRELLRRIEEIPGVRAAGAARLLPLGSQMGDAGVRVAGYVRSEGESTAAEWQWATPDYLEIMGIPLLEGRTFTDADGADAPAVMVINESLARHYWGDRNPLGGRVDTFAGDTATVIGVVADVRHNGIRSAARERFYRPLAQIMGTGTTRRMTLTIQTAGDPEAMINPIRRVVREMDPTMPVSEVRTVSEVLATSVAQPRFAMALLAVFAALALTLALVGIYGVLAFAVNRRTREIGVRMALGADSRQVVGEVVRDGMLMAILGVVAGVVSALGLSSLLQGMLYDVGNTDPVTYLVVPSVFTVVALLACWIPAARAARIPPSVALQVE